ncbi:MAG TPA: hypothetical protein VF913_10090, partial [Xanthobacteraceae bacterium]
MTAHKLTPQDKRLREHIVSIAALLGRRQSLERWLKVGLESKTRLPDVFFISDEQWKRIAENKAVPDKARVYVGIAI